MDANDARSGSIPRFENPLHTHQLHQEDIAAQVTELMQQSINRGPLPPTRLGQHQRQILFNPFFGNLHETSKNKLIIVAQRRRRFHTAAATSFAINATRRRTIERIGASSTTLTKHFAEATTSVEAQSNSNMTEDDECC